MQSQERRHHLGEGDREFKFVDGEAQVFEVSIVVKNLEQSMEQWRRLFGWEPYIVQDMPLPRLELHGKPASGARMKFACYHAGPIRFEIVEAAGGDSVYSEFLGQRGVGVQHIGIRVADHDKEVAELNKRGVEVLQHLDFPPANLKVSYLDTYDVAGVSFELVQSPTVPLEDA
jgi:methylmalonyl-CoA/ethylmalonyl-CoA epimerase